MRDEQFFHYSPDLLTEIKGSSIRPNIIYKIYFISFISFCFLYSCTHLSSVVFPQFACYQLTPYHHLAGGTVC